MKAILSSSQAIAQLVGSAKYLRVPVKKAKPELPELLTMPTRIKYARERAGLTRAAVAKRALVDPSQITRWEQGERADGVEAATVIRLARALGVPVGWLAADEGDPGPIPVFRDAGDKRRRKPTKPGGDKRAT